MSIPAAAEERVAKATKIQSQEFKSAVLRQASIPGEVRPNTILPERVYLEKSDLILPGSGRNENIPGGSRNEKWLILQNPGSFSGGSESLKGQPGSTVAGSSFHLIICGPIDR